MDCVFLFSIEKVKEDYSAFFSKLFSLEVEEKVWENAVKLGNELERLKNIVKEEEKKEYRLIEFTLNSAIKNINEYFKFLLGIFEKSPVETAGNKISEYDATLITIQYHLKKANEKFNRCVENHILYYKKK